jgi:predicted O-linked N-acetylglucosamine transferase (SPINDLY family)
MTAQASPLLAVPASDIPGALQAAQELCAAGRMAEARQVCDAVLALGANATALHLLGVILHQEGAPAQAVELLQRACELAPQDLQMRANLGVMLQQLRRFDEAERCLAECARLQVQEPEHHFKLGNLRREQGRYAEAVQCYARALRLQPTHKQALNNITITLWEDGQPDQAVSYAELALQLYEGQPAFLMLLAEAYRHAGRGADCERTLARARNAGADELSVALNQWGPCIARGAHQQAVLQLESALQRDTKHPPERHAAAFSTLLFTLNYMSNVSAAEIMRRHRQWGERFAGPAPAAHPNDATPDRKLRIGYVSADFRSHSVANFLLPLLEAHDRSAFEVFCYSNTARPDSVTQRIAAAAQVWRPIVGMDDASADRLIRADAIDLLVDLGGHSAENRLLLFARKPAPVQITWLGYPNTTGLPAMDYRVSDDICDPATENGGGAETVLRLPHGFHCFQPFSDTPDVAPPPCLARRHVAFGSFNTIVKLSDATLQAWAAILERVPGARLAIKNNGRVDAKTLEAQRRRMTACGLDPARVAFLPYEKGPSDHLARYGEIDIALDPFPYNGTTTTCEALWMGTPVITLCGDRHAARVGASLLTHVGRPEWIARTTDEYVRIAASLAADRAALGALRSGLRAALQASPVCDRTRFAQAIEAAFRSAWRRWCNR